MREHVTFLLNGAPVAVRDAAPTLTLLNYLRREKRLSGTKEGCAEGDCGACTVVVGELRDEGVVYRAVNACILLVAMLEGKAVITVEHVQGPGGQLHPCQHALVSAHGSQCGFCTPGFVMSLYAIYLTEPKPDRGRISDLLAGNLCRCTGYGPIIAAAQAMYDLPRPDWDRARRAADGVTLERIQHAETVALTHDGQRLFAPAAMGSLARLMARHPQATLVAGATDVGLWVTKRHRQLETVIHLGRVAALQQIGEAEGALTIGAGVALSDAEAALGRHHADLGELVRRFGGRQVRNAATIGGNIANGSPVGDLAPAFIALGSSLILRAGNARRTMPLEDFFLAYGEQDLRPGELVEAVVVPLIDQSHRLRCYKLSKRFDQDIAAVCGCFYIRVDGGRVAEARICFGGMAGVPKRARAVETALRGKPWSAGTIESAMPAFDDDYDPISDLRGSAAYRMRAAKNLLRKYFHETSAPLSQTRLVGRAAAFG